MSASPSRAASATLSALVWISAACAAAFFALAVLVGASPGWLERLDQRWSADAYAFTLDHGWCEALARAATFLGNGATITVLTVVVGLACVVRRRWQLGLWLALTVAGGALLGTAVKESLERMRPESAGVLTSAEGFAFPSGHARGATIAYVAVVLVVGWQVLRPERRARVASFALVTAVIGAVGISRVLLGAHWPSDVLGGWLLGSAWVTASTAVLLRLTAAKAHAPDA